MKHKQRVNFYADPLLDAQLAKRAISRQELRPLGRLTTFCVPLFLGSFAAPANNDWTPQLSINTASNPWTYETYDPPVTLDIGLATTSPAGVVTPPFCAGIYRISARISHVEMLAAPTQVIWGDLAGFTLT